MGPAGRILNEALEQAGIDRTRTYVTNVVKHFKWEPRDKRRIHAKPKAAEISACRLVTATVHPSSILREPDSLARRKAMQAFVRDLKHVRARLRTGQDSRSRRSRA